MRWGTPIPLLKSQLEMFQDFLGAIIENQDVASCGGVGEVVLKTLGRMPSIKISLHLPSSIHALPVQKLMTKPSFNLMGRIEMFALLKTLLPRVLVCLDFKCMRSTQCLCKVCQIFVEKQVLAQTWFSCGAVVRPLKKMFRISINFI